MSNFERGNVVLMDGRLAVLEEYCPQGQWEGKRGESPMWVGYILVPLGEYTSHDREIGIPGCRWLRDSDWVRKDPMVDTFCEEAVFSDEPCYFTVAELMREDAVYGTLTEACLLAAGEKRRQALDRRRRPRLTRADSARRMAIRQGYALVPIE